MGWVCHIVFFKFSVYSSACSSSVTLSSQFLILYMVWNICVFCTLYNICVFCIFSVVVTVDNTPVRLQLCDTAGQVRYILFSHIYTENVIINLLIITL